MRRVDRLSGGLPCSRISAFRPAANAQPDPSRRGGRSLWPALLIGAVLFSGCANLPPSPIDPTGEHLFAPPPGTHTPVPPGAPVPPSAGTGDILPWEIESITVTPQAIAAPIGSEVVLVASVRDGEGYLRTNERLEWTISPGGVGEFVDIDRGTFANVLILDLPRPHLVSSTRAIGSTSRHDMRLTRGTPDPSDDVLVRRGQTWVSVTSAMEGTTHVTALCRAVRVWERRLDQARIHWIDAQWSFPAPVIGRTGTPQPLTTTVTRQSDGAPAAGWIVRYEILDGPPAGFRPGGSPVLETTTDPSGQATVEIVPEGAHAGTNRVGIEVIRPAEVGGPHGTQLAMGQGVTMVTWSAPGIALHKTGPASAVVGSTVTYRIEVANTGDLPTEEALVVHEIPEGMEYVSSTPPAELAAGAPRWRLDALPPGATRLLEVNLRATRQGQFESCASVTAGQLTARDCATTTVRAADAALEVAILGPSQAEVGETVDFELRVTNRGQAAAEDLSLWSEFGEGFEHEAAESPITRDLGDIDPGQSIRVGLRLQVVRPGRWRQRVEVRRDDRAVAAAEHALSATDPTAPAEEPDPDRPPAAPGNLSVRKTGPGVAAVSETVDFTIVVSNTGRSSLSQVTIIDRADPQLEARQATEGAYRIGDDLAWTVDRLAPGESISMVIRYECLQAAAGVRTSVAVTSEEGVRGTAEARLDIRGGGAAAPADPPNSSSAEQPSPDLTLTLTATRDPVAVGREYAYVVEVGNEGRGAQRGVVVALALPPQATPVRLGTSGPSGYQVEGNVVQFDPLDQLPSGGRTTYRVRAVARRPGQGRAVARLLTADLQQPVEAETTTTIAAQ